MTTRVALLDKQTGGPEIREMFGKIEARGFAIHNLYRVLAHSPEIARGFLKLGNSIRHKMALAPSLRELAILRIGDLRKANYEWTKHIPIGLKAGVRQEQIDALPRWRESPAFDERERAVLAYADEMAQQVRVGEPTFRALRKLLGEREIVELTVTLGYYELVTRVLEALQVELEHE
jgi:alkylhydroperoxidase family enzyme